ncbi:MAG TPA: ribose-5-phosphate isomerase RpiA [Stellaceae bacterium]|nr:ribose-5-phosphate isomerase RpiA [Stellaceae bacterium]
MAQNDQDGMKRRAAARAVAEVESGMVLGLGSGTTASFALEALAARIAQGLQIVGIATSERIAAEARRLGVNLTSLAERRRIDLTIDGADQIERATLHLVKGLGGALLREKIVARASRRMIVIADRTKLVERLGALTPVPVEIVSFGHLVTIERLAELDAAPILRLARGAPFISDGGNYIVDCTFPEIADPAALEARLKAITGVVESGLFVGLADQAVIGGPDGVEILEA